MSTVEAKSGNHDIEEVQNVKPVTPEYCDSGNPRIEIIKQVGRYIVGNGLNHDRTEVIRDDRLPGRAIHLWRLNSPDKSQPTNVVTLFQVDKSWVDYSINQEGILKARRRARSIIRDRIQQKLAKENDGVSTETETSAKESRDDTNRQRR